MRGTKIGDICSAVTAVYMRNRTGMEERMLLVKGKLRKNCSFGKRCQTRAAVPGNSARMPFA